MRRVATFVVVAVGTAIASLWWLHEGDLGKAVKPVSAEWDAELLLRDAGIPSPEAAPADPATTDPASDPAGVDAPGVDAPAAGVDAPGVDAPGEDAPSEEPAAD